MSNSALLPTIDRLLDRIAAGPGGCWIWAGTVNSQRYGMWRSAGKLSYVHRTSYELHVGPIPDGMVIDHACHNRDLDCAGSLACLHRRCVNPDHLEIVTPRENQHLSPLTCASKTECIHGHGFTAENTYIRPDTGARQCRNCKRIRDRARAGLRT